VSLLLIAPLSMPGRPRFSEPDRKRNSASVRRPHRFDVVGVRVTDLADNDSAPGPIPSDERQMAVERVSPATSDERDLTAIRRPGRRLVVARANLAEQAQLAAQ